jgi:hypothetical protein
MDAYAYEAALYCPECANAIKQRLASMPEEEREDSGRYPAGPYANGGGEADTPQHCDACMIHLGNPLTPDGVEYVREAIAEGYGEEWREFYALGVDE